jgi:hypothetical protein
MWAKLGNALKPRQDDNDNGSIFHHHPNASTRSLAMSLDAPGSISSPPSSPSKPKRRGLFKRISVNVLKGDYDEGKPAPFDMSIGLPKRVKSHLHLNGNSTLFCFCIHLFY